MQNALIHGQPTQLRRILKWPYFPFAILGVFVFILHLMMKTGSGDDAWLANICMADGFDLSEYLVFRYLHWSSRIILEFLSVVGVWMPAILWKIIDTLIFVSVGVFISKIFVKDRGRQQINTVIAGMMMLYPFIDFYSAGWVATTVNYLWPLAFGLMAAYPLRKIADGRQLKAYEYALSVVLLLISVNHEQMCVVMLAVYGAFTVWMIAKRRVKAFVLVQLGICLLSLASILVCPGNAQRFASETASWFPDFPSFTLIQKTELGVSGSLAMLFLSGNKMFLLLSFFVCALVWQKHTRVLYRLVSAAPLLMLTVLFALIPMSADAYVGQLFTAVSKYGLLYAGMTFTALRMMFLFAMLFACGCLLISVYILLGRRFGTLTAAGVLLLGFATKTLVGFSPTVWASVNRTGMILMFSLAACTACLLNCWNHENKASSQMAAIIAVMAGVGGFAVNLVTI